MERTSKAQWKGSIKEGKDTLSAQSGILNNSPYSFHARFEDAMGTNPEELIGAAYAGCFAMMTTLLVT
ncbi:MAG: OsmC family peroxiredoxin [Flavobacteriales bacterium]